MSRKSYTVTVLGCALSWLLVGLHAPVLHELSHAGMSPRWGLLGLTVLLAVLAVSVTWLLLRRPRGSPWEPPAA